MRRYDPGAVLPDSRILIHSEGYLRDNGRVFCLIDRLQGPGRYVLASCSGSGPH